MIRPGHGFAAAKRRAKNLSPVPRETLSDEAPRPCRLHGLPAACIGCQHVRSEDALRRVNAALEQQARAIGQALHDEAGQVLAAAYTALAAAADQVPAAARRQLDEVRNHLELVEGELRRIAHELRPRILDDLGLLPALRFLTTGVYLRHQVRVTLAPSLRGPLPSTVETAVYRLVQEALTNITKHACATHVTIEVREDPGLLRCRIHDNGVGIDPQHAAATGLGLLGIRDRLDALGGTFTIKSRTGQGTDLSAVIPLERTNGRAHSARRRSSSCS